MMWCNVAKRQVVSFRQVLKIHQGTKNTREALYSVQISNIVFFQGFNGMRDLLDAVSEISDSYLP